jgi:glycosyltransferase involved in cell wall biosynthesis
MEVAPGLTVLMPVYNEARTVEAAVRQVLETEFPVPIELILIDDGSTDATAAVIAGTEWPDEVRVLRHAENKGKGAALRTGLREARGTYSTIIDADLEYDPADAVRLLDRMLDRSAEAVYGVRGFESHSAYSFWYVVGNKGLTMATNILYNSWISDLMTCHKMMRTKLFQRLSLRESGFAIEPEITARLLRSGVRIYEVPITYEARSRAQGKKLQAIDGLRVLRTLLRCRVA